MVPKVPDPSKHPEFYPRSQVPAYVKQLKAKIIHEHMFHWVAGFTDCESIPGQEKIEQKLH